MNSRAWIGLGVAVVLQGCAGTSGALRDDEVMSFKAGSGGASSFGFAPYSQGANRKAIDPRSPFYYPGYSR